MANRKVTKDTSDNIIASAVMASSIRSGAARIIEAHESDVHKVTVNKSSYLVPVQIGNFWFLVDTATHVDSSTDIDTGAVAPSTVYYVYAVTDEIVITFKTSISATNPTGYDTAHSTLLGGFTTDGSSDITAATIWDAKLKVTTGGYGMKIDGDQVITGTATGSGAPVRATSPTLVTPLLGTPTSGVLTNCTVATASDNDADTSISSTAYAKSQDAVLAREQDQGVAMTAGTSSSGITVADDANIDTGTGNFTWVFKGSVPSWSAATGAGQYLLAKVQDGSNYVVMFLDGNTGKLRYEHAKTGGTSVSKTTTSANGLVDGTVAEITMVVTRETAAVAGSVAFYKSGVLFETLTIAAGTPADISNTGSLAVLGYTTTRDAGTAHHAYTYNRALTAAEVVDLYRNGVADKHFDSRGVSPASQTAKTSGSLVVGKEYTIDDWKTDDDFVNVGGANVDGTIFVATGTTPTKWAAGSILRRTGATLYIPSEGWQPDRPIDFSGNALACTYPSAGWSLTRPWSYATLQAAANNAAAAGLTIPVPVGGLYRTNADPSVVCVRTA